jgi:hypothetical protein
MIKPAVTYAVNARLALLADSRDGFSEAAGSAILACMQDSMPPFRYRADAL